MYFYNLSDLVKGLDIVFFESGLNIWFDPDVDHRAFFNWCSNSLKYMGIDEVNGRHGDCYFICFECTNCGDSFCYHS